MSPQSERFEMRLDEDLSERINAWREKQDDMPSRAEAVRRLMEIGLNTLVMNESDQLIVSLLCEIHKSLKIKNSELDPGFIQAVLQGGHYWALKWKYPGLVHGYHDDEKTLNEVVDILDMWSFIEEAYRKMPQKDKEYIKTNTKHTDDIQFNGFDGNNENKHLNIAHFLINKMDRFTEFKDRGGYKGDLNCHYPSIEIYRRMLEVFMPLRRNLIGRSLNAKEFVEIWNARVHPTMKGKSENA